MPTKNRKTVSYASTINHKGIDYRINGSSVHGVFPKLVHVAIDQLDICISKWGRVFAMWFDLRQRLQVTDSKMITRFRKNLKRRLERKYQMCDMGYLWVREQETAKQQHYHFVVYLDGDRIRHSSSISKIILDTWEQICAGNSAHIPKRCFYTVVDYDSKADAIYRISYLAKVRGKGYRPEQSKDYGGSRLSPKLNAPVVVQVPEVVPPINDLRLPPTRYCSDCEKLSTRNAPLIKQAGNNIDDV